MKQILPRFLRKKSHGGKPRREKTLQEIQESIQTERSRLESIKKQLDEHDYDGALKNLLSDTSADLRYFNAVKAKVDPRHDAAFMERHGKLVDFKSPKEKHPPKDCCWVGLGFRNKKYRCHNKCLVLNAKETSFCAYHQKWCVNVMNHPDVPVKIKCTNEKALCNECFVLTYGYAPKVDRIPGTRMLN